MLCALLRSACWSCISSCAKTASCLGVNVGKLAWVYSALCGRSLRHCWHHSWCWAGLLLHPVDGLQRGYVKRGGCWVGQWRCHWHHWHGKRLRESRWCYCWLCDDRTELRGCWLRQLLQLERMGIPHMRKEAFLRSRGPQCRQSLALKSIRPSGRCRCKQSSQRIHLVDSVTGKQAGGTSLNADVQLSFVVQSACTGSLHSLVLMSAAYDALSRQEITDQGQGCSLRIQRQQQASKRSSQPACQAPCVRPAAAQAAIVDSRHSLHV